MTIKTKKELRKSKTREGGGGKNGPNIVCTYE
jgi:hypothetical protein